MIQIQVNQLTQIIDKIKNLAQNKSAGKTIIAVSGGSATGKTSQVSEQINHELVSAGLDSGILSQDNFQFGREFVDQFDHNEPSSESEKTLFQRIKKYKWDIPENFELNNCLVALEQIKANQAQISIPNFDVKAVTRLGVKSIEPNQVTIFEGLYSFYGELEAFDFDLKIYVETPFYARLLRRYFRFVYQMKIPRPTKALEQICTTVLRAHQDYVETQRLDADFVVEVPYNFKETISRIKLSPKPFVNLAEYKTLSELIFHENGKILVLQMQGRFYFIVSFENQIWENLEISEDLKNSLVTALEN